MKPYRPKSSSQPILDITHANFLLILFKNRCERFIRLKQHCAAINPAQAVPYKDTNCPRISWKNHMLSNWLASSIPETHDYMQTQKTTSW